MRVAVLADAHLGGPGGDPAPLLEQLAGFWGEGSTRLVILGDLFQVWVGYRKFETPAIRAVLNAIARLRRSGVRVDYIEGNRDFYLARGDYASSFDFVGTEIAFEDGGRRYLFVHGDGLNDRDRQYLAWRALSKSAPVRWATRALPRALVERLVDRTEKKLSGTNFKHKVRIPEEAIRRYAERRLAEGHDVLYLGHFHEPRTWTVAGGEVRLLEAWFTSRRIEWLG